MIPSLSCSPLDHVSIVFITFTHISIELGAYVVSMWGLCVLSSGMVLSLIILLLYLNHPCFTTLSFDHITGYVANAVTDLALIGLSVSNG